MVIPSDDGEGYIRLPEALKLLKEFFGDLWISNLKMGGILFYKETH